MLVLAKGNGYYPDVGAIYIHDLAIAGSATAVRAGSNGIRIDLAAAQKLNRLRIERVLIGGMGDTDVGGPVMNLVPRSGGNTLKGQVFWNTAGNWSRGDNLDDQLRNVNGIIDRVFSGSAAVVTSA